MGLGAIAVLIESVNWPDKGMIVRAGDVKMPGMSLHGDYYEECQSGAVLLEIEWSGLVTVTSLYST